MSTFDPAAATRSLFELRDLVVGADGECVLIHGDDEGFVIDGPTADPGLRRLLAQTSQAIADHPLPVIAAAPGPITGAGLELVLACDLRLVRSGARIALADDPAETSAPLPVGGLQRLVRLGGTSLATRMLVLGEQPIAGEDAVLDRFLTVTESPSQAATEALSTLAAAAPLATEALKSALAAAVELPLSAGLAVEADLACLLLPTSDRAEGLAAYAEGREPRFEGR